MLFKNITVIHADGTRLDNMTVGVGDGRFTYIGRDVPEGEWREIIDGSQKLIMPGFVNAHTHVPMTLMRGYGDDMPLERWLFDRIFPFEDKLDGNAVYWGSLLGIAEMLACGTTSFSDMYYFCESIIKAVTESGIKANIGRGISCFDHTKSFRDLPAYNELTHLIGSFQGAADGRVLVDVAPHSEYTTRPDILSDIAEFAAEHKARIQVHLSETQKEQLESTGRHGKTPASVMLDSGILELPVTAAHCVWITDLDMELLAEKKVTVAHCPQSNLKLGSGIARIAKMRQSGIRVALGTDSAASNNNLDMFQEVKTAALLAKGVSHDPCEMPAGEALYMATRAGALSQGRHDCGDIIQGNRADFVILNTRRPGIAPCHNPLSNLIYAAGAGDVEMTVVDGRILYRNGAFTTLDIERIIYEVDRCVKALV